MKKCTHKPARACEDKCPGWFVDGNNGYVARCDTCQRFKDDDEALEHVEYCLWKFEAHFPGLVRVGLRAIERNEQDSP